MGKFKNNSKEALRFLWVYNSADTMLPKEEYILPQKSQNKYKINDILNKVDSEQSISLRLYEDYEKNTFPSKITFFILSQDTINKYPWEEIRRTNNYLVRYDYTREQLESLNYTIEYPPTSRMKDIHMYPEFSTFYKSNE